MVIKNRSNCSKLKLSTFFFLVKLKSSCSELLFHFSQHFKCNGWVVHLEKGRLYLPLIIDMSEIRELCALLWGIWLIYLIGERPWISGVGPGKAKREVGVRRPPRGKMCPLSYRLPLLLRHYHYVVIWCQTQHLGGRGCCRTERSSLRWNQIKLLFWTFAKCVWV